MSDRPMHVVPGAFARLTELYADGERAIEEGRLEDAVAAFTAGIAIDDHFRQRYITMYAQRGFALQRLGRNEEAARDYTSALALGEPETNQAQYYFHRGMCREQLGDFGGAVADFTDSLARYDQHPGPYHHRGRTLINQLERFEEGIADLDRLLAMRESVDALHARGFAHYSLGNLDMAKADYLRAQASEPHPYASYMLACIAAVEGNAADMYAAMADAKRGDPSYAFDDDEFMPYRNLPQFIAIAKGR